MTIDAGLQTFLAAGLSTSRVWSHKAPQPLPAPADDPYIVFYRVSASPEHTHSGPAPQIERQFQFSCFARTQTPAIELGDRLRLLLDGYRGLVGDVLVTSAHWQGDHYAQDTTANLHQYSVDVRIRYREAE